MIKYKLTTQSMTTHDDFQWQVGVKVTTSGEGELCGPGWLHYYDSPELAMLMNPIHADIENPIGWKVEAEGIHKLDHGLKGGCTEMTLLEQIELPDISITQRVRFSILCALAVYSEPTFVRWANYWLNNEDRSAKTAQAIATAALAEAARVAAGTGKPLDLQSIALKALQEP